MINIEKIDIHVYRYPVVEPVRTSFGVMFDRPAVLVRVTDSDGCYGWGEIWCNFPTCGAEHRAKLCETVIGPALLETRQSSLDGLFSSLTQKTHILAIQANEFGSISQVIAGVMGAMWDLEARKAQQPLHRFLGGGGNGRIPVYASGINSIGAVDQVSKWQASGYNIFKVKIGFNFEDDLATIESVLHLLGETQKLNVDVNQAWSPDDALKRIAILQQYPLGWIEEPISADNGPEIYLKLSRTSEIAIAAGENIYGTEGFMRYIYDGAIGVVQPDLCKWGGPGACLDVAKKVIAADLLYCPHFLGAGIGLWTSGHILAAAGGEGVLEVDVNHNPLQTSLGEPRPPVENGSIQLPELPGIGVEPNLDEAKPYLVYGTSLKS